MDTEKKLIRQILTEKPAGQPVTVRGWVRTKRETKNLVFVQVNDGSCFSSIQVTFDKDAALPAETDAALKKITTGASVVAQGILAESPASGQAVEVQGSAIALIGEAPPDSYPLQKKNHTMEFLRREKELVGMYLSSHPLDKYAFEMETFTDCQLSDIPDIIAKCDNEKITTKLNVAGYITSTQALTSKTGSPWSKTVVEDFSGSYEFALFGKDHEVFMPYLTALSPIYIEGSVEEKYFVKPEDRKTRGNPPYTFKIKKITLLGNIAEEHIKGFSINISTSMLNNGFREKLITVVKHNKGNIPLSMTLFDPQTNYKIEFLSKKFRISVTMPFINELKDLNVNYSVIKK